MGALLTFNPVVNAMANGTTKKNTTDYTAPDYTPINPNDYTQNEATANQRMNEAWANAKNMPVALTPEEKLRQQNQVVGRHEQQNAGMTEQIKAQMAASGMGGSGAEIGGIARAMSRGASGLSGELTNLGSQQAQDELNRQYQKNAALTGAAAEFGNVGQGWDKARLDAATAQSQQANQLAYQKSMDEWSAKKYNQQEDVYMQMLNKIFPNLMNGSGSSNGQYTLGGG
jgi:hypothetical protein